MRRRRKKIEHLINSESANNLLNEFLGRAKHAKNNNRNDEDDGASPAAALLKEKQTKTKKIASKG